MSRYLDLLLLTAMVFLCAALLEFLLRSYLFDPNAAYIRIPGWGMSVRTNGLVPHISEDHLFQANRYGIRGKTPEYGAAPKVGILGGSTVEDWVLPDADTWVQQAASQLRDCTPNIWMANLGKSGVNARHHLIQLPEIAHYMPRFDYFVVLMGLNDFLYDLKIHHPFVTPDGWWRRQALMYDHSDEGSIAIIAISKRLYRQYVSGVNNSNSVSDFGIYAKSLLDAHAKVTGEQWVDSIPDLSEHLETYRHTISSLKAYADAYGVPIVFMTQPYVWSDDMAKEVKSQLYAGFIGSDMNSQNTKWYTTAALRKGLSAYNEALLAKCKLDQLRCIDAATILPKVATNFIDDFHFSKKGARELGTILADTMRHQILACR